MRKSILALAVGGIIAAATFTPVAPASADVLVVRPGEPRHVVVVPKHRYKRAAVVVTRPAPRVVHVVHRKPRHVMVVPARPRHREVLVVR